MPITTLRYALKSGLAGLAETQMLFFFLGLIYLPAAEGTHFDQYGRAGFFGVGCQHGTGGNSPITQERKSLC